ncbi:MAG: hypothetical protein IPG14_10785 [Dehalococcoidia bacterium]|nr:hypothetical protein [Dehalococcoidia bacterium]
MDDVAQTLAAHGPVLVDAGGDMVSSAPLAEPWPIAVQNPFHASTTCSPWL